MECEHFQEDLPDLLYGELPPERRAWAEYHASGCADCQSLWGELRAVRQAVSPVVAPPQLTDRLKLAARDALLAEQAPPPAGGPALLGKVATTILAVCVCLAGFALGVSYERRRPDALPARDARPLPNDSGLEGTAPAEPGAGSPGDRTGRPRPTPPPPDAGWQQVLHDAARERLRTQDWAAAQEFFQRAAAIDPTTRLATSAEVGAAEALLGAGQRDRAAAALEALRRQVRAGRRPADAALLQRISELLAEAERPPGGGEEQ